MLYNILLELAFSHVRQSTNVPMVHVVKPRTFVEFEQQWGTLDQSTTSDFLCVLNMVFTA